MSESDMPPVSRAWSRIKNPFRTTSDVPTQNRVRRHATMDFALSQPQPMQNLVQGMPQHGEGLAQAWKPERSRLVDVQGDLPRGSKSKVVKKESSLTRSLTDPDLVEYVQYKKRLTKSKVCKPTKNKQKLIQKPQDSEKIQFARKVAASVFIIGSSLWFLEAATNPNNKHLFQSFEDFYVGWIKQWFDVGKALQDTLDRYIGIHKGILEILFDLMNYTNVETKETRFLDANI